MTERVGCSSVCHSNRDPACAPERQCTAVPGSSQIRVWADEHVSGHGSFDMGRPRKWIIDRRTLR